MLRYAIASVGVLGLGASTFGVTVTNSYHQGAGISDALLLSGTNLVQGIHGAEVSNYNSSGVSSAHNTINISNPNFSVAGTAIYASQVYNPSSPHFFYIEGENNKTNRLTDGTLGWVSSTDNKGFFGPGNPNYIDYSVTVHLDTTVNTLGYNVDEIGVFAGQNNENVPDRYYIKYSIEYSLVGSSAFVALTGASADYNPTIPYAPVVTKSVVDDVNLTGVDAIRFNILNPGSQFATTYREFQVIGTPVPEPTALGLLGGAAVLGLRRRRR